MIVKTFSLPHSVWGTLSLHGKHFINWLIGDAKQHTISPKGELQEWMDGWMNKWGRGNKPAVPNPRTFYSPPESSQNSTEFLPSRGVRFLSHFHFLQAAVKSNLVCNIYFSFKCGVYICPISRESSSGGLSSSWSGDSFDGVSDLLVRLSIFTYQWHI